MVNVILDHGLISVKGLSGEVETIVTLNHVLTKVGIKGKIE